MVVPLNPRGTRKEMQNPAKNSSCSTTASGRIRKWDTKNRVSAAVARRTCLVHVAVYKNLYKTSHPAHDVACARRACLAHVAFLHKSVTTSRASNVRIAWVKNLPFTNRNKTARKTCGSPQISEALCAQA